AAVVRSGSDWPPIARIPTAVTVKATFAMTFQTRGSPGAPPTCSTRKFHFRSIEYDRAIPIASPPGITLDAAADDCDISSALRNDRPGSAAIQGGANVRTLRIAAPTSSAMSFVERPWMTCQTAP